MQTKTAELRIRAAELLASAVRPENVAYRAVMIAMAASYEEMARKLEAVAVPFGRWDISDPNRR
jgi:hypothetical protein